jgi:hypothetical protein
VCSTFTADKSQGFEKKKDKGGERNSKKHLSTKSSFDKRKAAGL